MNIQFERDITLPDQDGFGLLFAVNGVPFRIQISRSALAAFSFPDGMPKDANQLQDYVIFDKLISDIVESVGNQKISSYDVTMHSEGVSLHGKIVYTRDQLKQYVKVRWIG